MKSLDRFRDEPVTLTHTAPERFVPGELFQWREGHPTYRITRVRRVADTALFNGGGAPCWEVRGVKTKTAGQERVMKCNCGSPTEHAKRKQAFDDWWNGRITADEFERIMGWLQTPINDTNRLTVIGQP